MDENNAPQPTGSVPQPPRNDPPHFDPPPYQPPAQEPIEQKKSLLDRIRSMNRRTMALVGGGVALVILLALLIPLLVGALTNSRNAPLRMLEKYANAEKLNYENDTNAVLNRIDGGRVRKIIRILRKGSEENAYYEDLEADFAEGILDAKDEYGSNYKIRYTVDSEDVEKLERSERNYYRDRIRSIGEDYINTAKRLKGMKTSELREIAEDLDIELDDLRKIIDLMKDLGQDLKKADVSEAYTMEVLQTITGSELDDPEEEYDDLVVLKVNGRWVSSDAVYELSRLLYHLTRTYF